MQISKTEDN